MTQPITLKSDKSHKEFARKARRELRKVQLHFPGLQLGKKRGCLEILPTSLPAIAPKTLGDKPAH